jgi:DNA-binding NarL/FixJ family response regulator
MTDAARSLRVLLVDDDTGFRAMVRSMIETVALEAQIVGEAGDGDEAILMAHQFSPDLILMDFQMPGLDGAAAALAIKEFLPNARVVLLSGTDDAVAAAARIEIEMVAKVGIDPDVLANLLRAPGT